LGLPITLTPSAPAMLEPALAGDGNLAGAPAGKDSSTDLVARALRILDEETQAWRLRQAAPAGPGGGP
jgi:hypothetical protein